MTTNGAAEQYDDYADRGSELGVGEYDIAIVPSDFNVMTLTQLIDNGWVRIPGFQRHFVWDLKRASKLIESLILGLPVPQLFLYEKSPGMNLLIDGQQRLMSIYYFKEQRFPRKDRRADLRRIFDEHGKIPEDVLQDEEYFELFKLNLPESLPNQRNELGGLSYDTLDNYRSRLDMRPIRCITIKQNSPSEGDMAMYEVFNRLNSGGVNLTPQEIRSSMYHSKFYDMLNHINAEKDWRAMQKFQHLDLHMKDIETLLRGFAMLIDGDEYRPSMAKFLNQFSKKCQTNDHDQNERLRLLFQSFLRATCDLRDDIFLNPSTRQFNMALFEAVFTATCRPAYRSGGLVDKALSAENIEKLRADAEFNAATQKATTQTKNVRERLKIARSILGAA